MKNETQDNTWSLRDLDRAFYAQFDVGEEIITATVSVIESILNPKIEPRARLEAYRTLDKLLQGNNAVYRTPIIMSISGANEIQAAVANGCGPNGLGIFPGGWWEKCCNDHDRCYDQGGGVAAKLICDAIFWKCLWSRGAPIIAELYGLAVLLFGWPAFDWSDDEETEPMPCSGICRGTEYRITNLRNFQTVGRSVTQVLLNDVPRGGRARLAAEARELSTTKWSEHCSSGCRCNITVGDWQRNVTFLTVPANDPNVHVNYHCEATIWKREVSGTCE